MWKTKLSKKNKVENVKEKTEKKKKTSQKLCSLS